MATTYRYVSKCELCKSKRQSAERSATTQVVFIFHLFLLTTHTYRFISSIECDATTSGGDAFIFQIKLYYPQSLPCQTSVCHIDLFTEIRDAFATTKDATIETSNGQTLDLDLCEFDDDYSDDNSEDYIIGESTVFF